MARARGGDNFVYRMREKIPGEAEKNSNGQSAHNRNAAQVENSGELVPAFAAAAVCG